MANVKSIFELPTRPCWVDGRRAIFHRWTDSARPAKPRGLEEDDEVQRFQLHNVHALVEYEDGTLARVWPNVVQFADSEQLFSQHDWETMEAKRDALPYTFDEAAEAKTAEHVPGNLRNCLNCGVTPAKENCGYDCENCIRKCHCRNCNGASEWVPKEEWNMATCRDCLHDEACRSMLRDLGYTVDGDGLDADKRCPEFEEKTKYAEVVRCDDCKYCDPENRHCDHPMGTTMPVPRKIDDFCSYGERKGNG